MGVKFGGKDEGGREKFIQVCHSFFLSRANHVQHAVVALYKL